MIRRILTCLCIVVVVAVTLLTRTGGKATTAQEATTEATVEATVVPSPTVTPTAYAFRALTFNLMARADISVATDGPVTVSAASVSIPVLSETVPFQTQGPTVITVQTGAVTITADQATVGVTDVVSLIGLEIPVGTPVAAEQLTVQLGTQVVLPAGATATLRNDSEVTPATVVILTVVPSGEATSTP